MMKRLFLLSMTLIFGSFSLGQVEDTGAMQLGKKVPGDGTYTYSNVAGYPMPNYAIIPIDKDVNVEAVANNGWILFNDDVRWKWGVEEHLQAPSSSFYPSDMNNNGEVIGHGSDPQGGNRPIVWSANSSNGSFLSNGGDLTYAYHIDDAGNFYGHYLITTEIIPPLTYPCGEDDQSECSYYKSFFRESFHYSSNIDANSYSILARSSNYTLCPQPFTCFPGLRPEGEFVNFRDAYFDIDTQILDYIFIRGDSGCYENCSTSIISNFAQNLDLLDIVPSTIGKGQVVVGTTNGQYCIWKNQSVTLLGEYADPERAKKIWIAHLQNDDELIVAGKEMWLNIENSEGIPTGNYLRLSLGELVDPDSGWTDLEAQAMSDNGFIAGYGNFNGETKNFLLVPTSVEVESIDRYVTGYIDLPSNLDGLELRLKNKSSGEVFGTYEKLWEAYSKASDNFYIYESIDAIFGDSEGTQFDVGILDSRAIDQSVIFYKDTENPNRLMFVTVFDAIGEVEVELWHENFGKVSVVEETLEADAVVGETLKAGADFLAAYGEPVDESQPQWVDPVWIVEAIDDDPNGGGVVTTAALGSSLARMSTLTFNQTEEMTLAFAQTEESTSSVTEPQEGRLLSNAPSTNHEQIRNVLGKMFLPSFKHGTVDKTNEEAIHALRLKMIFYRSMFEGFVDGIYCEVSDLLYVGGAMNQVVGAKFRLIRDLHTDFFDTNVRIYNRGQEMYYAFKEIAEMLNELGASGVMDGLRNFGSNIINEIKGQADEIDAWLWSDAVSEEQAAELLGYVAGFAIEQLAIGYVATIAVKGIYKAVTIVKKLRAGEKIFSILPVGIQFRLRTLMWASRGAGSLNELKSITRMLRQISKREWRGVKGKHLEILGTRYADDLGAIITESRLSNGGDWDKTHAVLARLAEVSDTIGPNATDALSSSALKGFVRLGHSMPKLLNTTEKIYDVRGIKAIRNYLAKEPDLAIDPSAGSLTKADADSFFGMFDDGGFFTLDADGATWIYKGELKYKQMDSVLFNESHRIEHAMHHWVEHPGRTSNYSGDLISHGAYGEGPADMFEVIYQSWKMPEISGSKVLDETRSTVSRKNYILDWSPLDIGKTNKNPVGGVNYESTTNSRLIIDNTDEFVTSYPE